MKPIQSIQAQNQNLVSAFLKRKSLITISELFIFILIAIALCLTSCSPVLYTTVGQNVPLFHKKGEVAASVAHAGTNYADGTSFQVAAAIDSNTLLMSSFYSLNNVAGSGSGRYFELGAGKFKYNPVTKLCGELILGVGFGSINNSFRTDPYYNTYTNVNANYFKPFIQPSFGFSTKIIDIALTPRVGLVTYTSKSDNVTDPQLRSALDDYYSAKKSTLVFEPGITVRAGFKNVKLQVQYNHTSFNYTSANLDPVDKDFVSVGLHILISDRWAKSK